MHRTFSASARAALVLSAVFVATVVLALDPRPAFAVPDVPDGFEDQLVVGPLDRPVAITFLPDGRLLVVELKSAKIRMVVGGDLASNDPLIVVDSVKVDEEEQGLLSVAVDPRWPVKPYIYTHYTAPGQTIRVSRFTAAGDLSNPASGNLALLQNSRRDLLRDIPDLIGNHNGGTLRFAPDSMLYWSIGEDALACTALDSTALHGVIVRMDIRGLPDTPGITAPALLVPADNPFATHPNVNVRLVWSLGLRNPFRFHVDPLNGNLMIADVGWEKKEELNVADRGGIDFGWPYYEGTEPYVVNECGPLQPPGLTPPAYEYDRDEYCPGPCAATIIGGMVYRRDPMAPFAFPPGYDGRYFFSDYYEGFLRQLEENAGSWSVAAAVPGQPNATDWGREYREVTDFAQGTDGAIYYTRMAYSYTDSSGEVRRIAYNGGLASAPRRTPHAAFSAPYPVPVRDGVHLQWSLGRPARTRLAIYDALGRRVRTLRDDVLLDAGEHRLRWNGESDTGARLAPGIYVVRLAVDGEVHERRFPLLR